MDSVGELLRRERLRQGLELAEVAERTRINQRYLEAIEAGDTENLPGAFFYRAFVRQYARLLDVDESQLEPTLSELRVQAEAEQPLPSPSPLPHPIEVPPIPMPASLERAAGPRVSSIVLLVAVIIACTGIYALWHRWRTQSQLSTAQSSEIQRPSQPPRIPAASPGPESTPPTTVAAAETPGQTQPPDTQQPVTQSPSQPVPAADSPPAAAAEVKPAPPPEPPQPAAVDARLNIEVSALGMVWFSMNIDGKTVFSNVLQAGQSRRFGGNDQARLLIGNAGGLEIRVNGKPLGPIGPRGHVRVVVITPEGVTITNPREKKEQPNSQ